jgi:hypothetical protein
MYPFGSVFLFALLAGLYAGPGGQDGLQLQLEGVRLHFGVCIYHRALVLKCSCIDAVLERNQNRVDDESIQM